MAVLTEETSRRVASIAARGLRGEALTAAEVKTVCASALTQTGHHDPKVVAAAEQHLRSANSETVAQRLLREKFDRT